MFIFSILIVIIESLAIAQQYFSIITELHEGMYQSQYRVINFYENYGHYHIQYYKGLL